MITYIVYEESERYPLSSLLFLYEPLRDGREVFMVGKPENPAALPQALDSFPLKGLTNEWRILFLDCGQVYGCENPYENYEEQFQYIEEFLKACERPDGGKFGRRITRFLPRKIYCVTLRSGLYFHTEEEGYLYSDFAGGRNSRYRYLICDVGKEEPALPERTLFYALCSALTLALNEWQGAMLETGYLYQCRIEIDEDRLSAYIGDMEETRRYLDIMLSKEKQESFYKGEYLYDIHEIPQRAAQAKVGKGTIAFEKGAFSFLPEDNAVELSRFRIKNIRAIQRLRELENDPALRWVAVRREREDGFEKEAEEEYRQEETEQKRLSEKGLWELAKQKTTCAEKIFKEPLFTPELWESLEKSRALVQAMESKLRCQITKGSFRELWKEGLVGLAVIGGSFGLLTAGTEGGRIWTAIWICLGAAVLFTSGVFFSGRGRALKKLNRSLKAVDNGLRKADEAYERMLAAASQYRSCCLLERRQRKLRKAEKERQERLAAYERMLCKSEGNIQQLLWIFGKQPVLRGDIGNKVSVDFSLPPEAVINSYMPHEKKEYEFVIKGAGLKARAPFSFLADFEIRKLYLPYVDKNAGGEEEDDNEG